MIIVHDVAMGDVIITNWTNVIQTKKNFSKIKRFQIIILQGKPRETCHPMTFHRITFHPMNYETCHLNRPSITQCLPNSKCLANAMNFETSNDLSHESIPCNDSLFIELPRNYACKAKNRQSMNWICHIES